MVYSAQLVHNCQLTVVYTGRITCFKTPLNISCLSTCAGSIQVESNRRKDHQVTSRGTSYPLYFTHTYDLIIRLSPVISDVVVMTLGINEEKQRIHQLLDWLCSFAPYKQLGIKRKGVLVYVLSDHDLHTFVLAFQSTTCTPTTSQAAYFSYPLPRLRSQVQVVTS